MALVKLTTVDRTRIWIESREVQAAIVVDGVVTLRMRSTSIYFINWDSYRNRQAEAIHPRLPEPEVLT